METRIFLIFVLCSSLPLLAFAIFSYSEMRDQSLERTSKELHTASKNYALLVYARLQDIKVHLRSLEKIPKANQKLMLENLPFVTSTSFTPDDLRVPSQQEASLSFQDNALWIGLAFTESVRWFKVDTNLLLYDIEDAPYEHKRCVQIAQLKPVCNAKTINSSDALKSSWSLFTSSSFESDVSFGVTSFIQRDNALAAVNVASQIFPAAALLASLLIALVAIKLLKHRLQPLTHLEEAANDIAEGDYSIKLEISSRDEFESVAHAFNRMSQRLDTSFNLMHALAEIDALILSTTALDDIIQPVLTISRKYFDTEVIFIYAPEKTPEKVSIFQLRRNKSLLTTNIEGINLDSSYNDIVENINVGAGSNYIAYEPVMADSRIAGWFCISKELEREIRFSGKNLHQLIDRMSVAVVHFEKKETLFQKAHFDSLTGLSNRQSLEDNLAQILRQTERDNTQGAVLFMDLDRFKQVNDTEGHKAGDNLLLQLSARLKTVVRNSDILARMGGDEFAIVVSKFRKPQELSLLCKRLVEAISLPVKIDKNEYRMGVSIGVSTFPHDGTNVEDLLIGADSAMYQAKNSNGSGYSFFDSSLNKENINRTRIEMQLRKAIEHQQLDVHFQAQLRLKENLIGSVEALTRWQDSELGWVSPEDFISIAEEIGLVHKLLPIIVRNAADLIAEVKDRHDTDLRVAINASPHELKAGYADNLLSLISQNSALPRNFEVEITESVFITDLDVTTKELVKLRSAGVLIALDDFGTGYSSLSLLRRLPLDYLKLDRSLVKELTTSTEARALVQHVIEIAKALGLQVIAEGTEEQAEIEILRDFDCDIAQGYFIARPMAADPFLDFLDSYARDQITRSIIAQPEPTQSSTSSKNL